VAFNSVQRRQMQLQGQIFSIEEYSIDDDDREAELIQVIFQPTF